MANSLAILVPVLAGLSILGAYVGPIAIGTNGFGDASWLYLQGPSDASQAGFPGAPRPAFREYTGIGPLDAALLAPVAFFSALLDGDVAPQVGLYGYWALWQFPSLSVLLMLEGMRAGNRRRLVGWTSSMLLIAQWASWQFLIPLWVMLHLFTSPIARPAVSKSSLLVDLWDIAVLPLTVLLAVLLPTIAMYLPASMISAQGHYKALAFWQPFPLWHYILHTGLSALGRIFLSPLNGSDKGSVHHPAYLVRVKGVYDLVFLAGLAGQLPIVLLTLAPKNVLSSVTDTLPWLKPYTTSPVCLSSVFAPRSPWNIPTVDAQTIKSGDLGPLAMYFLHWDMYIGCGALLLWAMYLHHNTIKSGSLFQLLAKVAAWFALGGFTSAIAGLLEERDLHVLESEPVDKKRI